MFLSQRGNKTADPGSGRPPGRPEPAEADENAIGSPAPQGPTDTWDDLGDGTGQEKDDEDNLDDANDDLGDETT